MSSRNLSYAIDFGTTNSTVATVDPSGKVRVLPLDSKAKDPQVVRSVIYLSPEEKFTFARTAINDYLEEIAKGKPWGFERVFTGKYIEVTKAFSAGSGYQGEEMVPEIIEVEINPGGRLFQSLKTALSSKIVTEFRYLEKKYSLEQLVGLYLGYLKQKADFIVGKKIDNVVMGRPVHFAGEDDKLAQKKLRKAAILAGFKNIEFELEPVGAALDYGLEAKEEKQTVLVFDFGGGTLDFSVVKFPEKKVLATHGLAIGGDLFNSEIFMQRIARYFGSEATFGDKHLEFPGHIYERLKSWYQISVLKNQDFMASLEHLKYKCSDKDALSALESLVFNNLGLALYEEIDRTKKSLSTVDDETFLFNASKIDICEELSRDNFENMITTHINEIDEGIDKVVLEAGLKSSDIDRVVTTGGSSLIPVVNLLLAKKFGKDKIKSSRAFTSVARGLAIRANEVFG